MDKGIYMDYELIAKALFESFETIYDIDLETSAYKCFHESEDYKKLKLEKSGDNFFEALPSGVEEIIAEDDREYVLEMLSRDNLVRGLQEDKYYTFIYRIKRNGKEVYHQITATLQPTEEGTHVYMGVKNIDNLMQREIRHRAELSSLQQKEANHMKAVLASSAAYMEINLSKDLVLEKSDDITAVEKRFIKKIPSLEEIPKYSDLHDWICENLVVENEKQYREVGSPEALLNHFYGGTLRASVLFSISTKEGGILPCREVFYLYKDQETDDVHMFCVIYDLTEQQKRVQEKKQLEQALRMSRIRNFTSQMQPHFLYNALGSIQEVILMDPEYASELLGYFTVHLRSCIRAMTKDEPLAFSQELENVKAYVSIEKMRFGNKLRMEYDTRVTRFSILPLTIQPLVENAIRHGIYGRGPEGGVVYVRTRERADRWIVEIEDTGVGFDVEEYYRRQRIGEGDSTGLRNIQFRLEKVMGASLKVESKIGIGTKVTVSIPKTEERDESDYR